MAKSPDPTKAEGFRRVVEAFLRTPPKPHKAAKKARKVKRKTAKPRS